jgi:hypothetical protein
LLDGAAPGVQGVGETIRVVDVAAVACLFYSVQDVTYEFLSGQQQVQRHSEGHLRVLGLVDGSRAG